MDKLLLMVGHLLVFAVTLMTIKSALGDMKNGWGAAVVMAGLLNLGVQHIAGANARIERQQERNRQGGA